MPVATSSSSSGPQPQAGLLRYKGHQSFRQRLILSTLLGRPVRIDAIRPNAANPGIRDYEAGFLRLLEKLTNGSAVEISYTGTSVLYKPGVLTGGNVTHDCGTARSVGWFAECVVALAPWGKRDLSLTLKGITSAEDALSADTLRTVTLPHLQLFGITEGLELRITKRGSPPLGGGEITLTCPALARPKTLNFTSPGRIKRIRGISHSTRVSPQLSNRLIASARSLINRYIPDIHLFSDVYRGAEAGLSPGYGLTLVAESTTGVLHSSEALSSSPSGDEQRTPEDVGLQAARALLREVRRGGCVERQHQWLVCLWMALGSEDVGRCRMGELSPHTVQFLRDLRDFSGVTFKIRALDSSLPAPSSGAQSNVDEDGEGEAERQERERGEVMLSCVGIGFVGQRKVG